MGFFCAHKIRERVTDVLGWREGIYQSRKSDWSEGISLDVDESLSGKNNQSVAQNKMLVDLSIALRAWLSVWSPYNSPPEPRQCWCASSQCACEIGKGFLILSLERAEKWKDHCLPALWDRLGFQGHPRSHSFGLASETCPRSCRKVHGEAQTFSVGILNPWGPSFHFLPFAAVTADLFLGWVSALYLCAWGIITRLHR